ncbi:MAG: hypothetical protein J7K11_01350 [Candidatus Hydrothermae bacterium]|nr:hypothetical protein [Candidatus Hydrothermae bacterium]
MRKAVFILILALASGGFASHGQTKKPERKPKKSLASKFDNFIDKDGDGVNDLVEKKNFLKGILEIINEEGEKKSDKKQDKTPIKDSILRKKAGKKRGGK